MWDDRPIGLFDTGVGGVLVFEKLRRRFPTESFICLADACFLGMVDRVHPSVTRAWSRSTATRLVEEYGCKALIVACNSAYIAGRDYFSTCHLGPMAGPVEHAARAAASATRNGVVGVLATGYTVSTQVYQETLKKVDPSLMVIQEGCPEWVQWVERAEDDPERWNGSYKKHLLELHLKPLRTAGCDTIILGCTHFPALATPIRESYALPVTLVDGAEGIGDWMNDLFSCGALLPGSKQGGLTYLVTGELDRFQNLGRRLLNDEHFTPQFDEGWPSQGEEIRASKEVRAMLAAS